MDRDNKIRVLIADDQKDIRLLLQKALISIGADLVGEAANGVEAIKLYQEKKPDFMLLDYMMPELTGEAVLKSIMAEFPDALIVMLTSIDDTEAVEQCIESGAIGYILKTTPIREIKELLLEIWAEQELI